MDNIQKWAESKTGIKEYLPDYDYDKNPNREWYCNVCKDNSDNEFSKHLMPRWLQKLYWKRANQKKRKDHREEAAKSNDGPGDI